MCGALPMQRIDVASQNLWTAAAGVSSGGEAMAAKHYDLIVIGGGAAGEKGAAQAAYFGKKVAMIERDIHLGGATAGTTVPSKTLRETALILSGYRARKLHGIDLSLHHQATVQDFLYHEEFVKKTERFRVMNNMLSHQVDVFHGRGTFVGAKTVRVETAKKDGLLLDADILLIATGSSPRRPPMYPADERIFDSDTILQIRDLPKKLVVVGGGVIGCEYACIFKALDTDVWLVHSRAGLLPFLDGDISSALKKSMEKMGIHMAMPEVVMSCSARPEAVVLEFESGGVIETPSVMLATGRTSNTATMNLKATGITLNRHGFIPVDDNYQVTDPNTREPVEGIFACGDVIGAPSLASTSMEQARYAMIKAFDLEPYKTQVAPILPLGIYTIPECSGAGKTEKDCRKAQLPHVVGRASYGQNPRGMIMGDFDGFLKLIYADSGRNNEPMKLLGVHVIGEIASEIVHIGLTALMMNATSELFINTCFNYPTLGDLYKYATYDALDKRSRNRNDPAGVPTGALAIEI